MNSFRTFVGLVQPPQRIAQVVCRMHLERMPVRSRQEARFLGGALVHIGWHRIEPETDRIWSSDGARDRKSGKDFRASKDTEHAKHGFHADVRPAAHFGFQQRRPVFHLFGNRRHLRAVAHAPRSCLGWRISFCFLCFLCLFHPALPRHEAALEARRSSDAPRFSKDSAWVTIPSMMLAALGRSCSSPVASPTTVKYISKSCFLRASA